MKLFIRDGNLSGRKIVTSPFDLNDAIVSKIDRFIAIVCKSFESFKIKSWIDIFMFKPASIGSAFDAFFFGHRFLVL